MTATGHAQHAALARPVAGRDAAAAAAWLIAGFIAAGFVSLYLRDGSLGSDSQAYWHAAHDGIRYGSTPGAWGAYLYSPAFAQLVVPLSVLPVSAFCAVWSLAEAAACAWLVRPLGVRWGVPLFVLCVPELALGNVYAFFALVVVIGFRYPAAWAFPALTKVTPAVGFVWFAVRREWRNLAITAAVTGAIALASFALAPGQWSAWLTFLHTGREMSPWVTGRLALGVLVAALAARRGAHWMLAIALMLGTPLLFHESSLCMLAALPRLVQMGTPQPRQVIAPPVSRHQTST